MRPPGGCRRPEQAFHDGVDGEMLRQRRRDEGDHRRGADFRRRRIHEGLSRRAHDARREDQPDLRRHQSDPAGGDLPPSPAMSKVVQRKSKLKSLAAALAPLQDGMEVATGGWIFTAQPMALVREIVRRGLRNLRLIPAPGSIAPDMLIGAGCVSSTACVFISFEQFGLAPHFRRAAESGTIEIREMDGPAIAGGLRAGATDLPYMLIPDMATDLPRVNPACYRPVP